MCRLQAALRGRLGEGTTAFERITDGTRTVSRGDVVRVSAKPLLVGRVTAFTIPQVCLCGYGLAPLTGWLWRHWGAGAWRG